MSQMSLTGEGDGYAPNSGRPAYDEIRPLSVRMRDSVRAQLAVLAQLNNRSVTEETRLALEHWVEKAKTDPSLKERADRVRAEIDREVELKRRSAERDAEHRRQAIAAVLGVDGMPPELDEESGVQASAEAEYEPESEPDDVEITEQSEPVGQEESASEPDTPSAEDSAPVPGDNAAATETPVKQARIQRRKAG